MICRRRRGDALPITWWPAAKLDVISDALPFGRLSYCEVSDAIDYAKFLSRSPPQ